MKPKAFLLLALGATAAYAWADSLPVSSPAITPLHSVLVYAIGKDSANTAEAELDVLQTLADHQVTGERVSKIFPQGVPDVAAGAIAQMRAAGCETLLVLRRRSAVDWESASKDHAYTSLQAFLNRRPQLLKSKNQAETASAAPIEVPNAYSNTVMEVDKGEVILFDLASEKMIWRGDSQVKVAKDLPQAKYYKLVAQKVADVLTAGGLLLPGKK